MPAAVTALTARMRSIQFIQEMHVRSVSQLLRSSSGIDGNRKSRLSGSLVIRVIGGYVACLHVLTKKSPGRLWEQGCYVVKWSLAGPCLIW